MSVYFSDPVSGVNRTAQRPVLVEQKFFWKALFCLLAFDLFCLGKNFPRLYRLLRRTKAANVEYRNDAVEQICGAVNRACVWYPKTVLCLQRSVVTTYLLRRLGVPANVVFGAQIIPFKAHAWTEVGREAVNEKTDVKKHYTVWDRC